MEFHRGQYLIRLFSISSCVTFLFPQRRRGSQLLMIPHLIVLTKKNDLVIKEVQHISKVLFLNDLTLTT